MASYYSVGERRPTPGDSDERENAGHVQGGVVTPARGIRTASWTEAPARKQSSEGLEDDAGHYRSPCPLWSDHSTCRMAWERRQSQTLASWAPPAGPFSCHPQGMPPPPPTSH